MHSFRKGMIALLMVAGAADLGNAQSAGQQVAILKMLKPGTTVIGVLTTTATDKSMESLTRAGTGQGVKIVFARPKGPGEVSTLYRKLVADDQLKLILVPDVQDELILGMAFDYLRDQSIADKVGLCVLDESYVAKGALCAILSENGKVRVVVNQKMAQLVSATVPAEGTTSALFVAR
jgi:ABC-type uncharacterized transport system substrate-binding protein